MQSERRSLFSTRDRRRLAAALRQITTARLFRRVQAVLRVAEGYTVAEAGALGRDGPCQRASLGGRCMGAVVR